MRSAEPCGFGGVREARKAVEPILEAHSRGPHKPTYEAADKFSGLADRANCIAPALRQFVAREVRDEAEVEPQRSKARGWQEERQLQRTEK